MMITWLEALNTTILVPVWLLPVCVFLGTLICWVASSLAGGSRRRVRQTGISPDSSGVKLIVPDSIRKNDIRKKKASIGGTKDTKAASTVVADAPVSIRYVITPEQRTELMRRVGLREMYLVKDVAVLLGIADSVVIGMIRSGKLLSVVIGNERWVDSRTVLAVVDSAGSGGTQP